MVAEGMAGVMAEARVAAAKVVAKVAETEAVAMVMDRTAVELAEMEEPRAGEVTVAVTAVSARREATAGACTSLACSSQGCPSSWPRARPAPRP